jgi:hypothetical protein
VGIATSWANFLLIAERADYRLIIEEPQADFLYGNRTFDFGEPTGTIGLGCVKTHEKII